MSLARETFQKYVAAATATSSAFLDYKFGKVSEAEVRRLQRREALARDAHIRALDEAVDTVKS